MLIFNTPRRRKATTLARREERLRALAARLEPRVRTGVVPLDLAVEGTPRPGRGTIS